jgi:hypothetical protein
MHACLPLRNITSTCKRDLIIPAATLQGAEKIVSRYRYVLLSHALASHTSAKHVLIAKVRHRCSPTAATITH